MARAFHRALARGTAEVVDSLCEMHGVDTVVLSGGVMQNELFLSDLTAALSLRSRRTTWLHIAFLDKREVQEEVFNHR